jgi:hypothetical protein
MEEIRRRAISDADHTRFARIGSLNSDRWVHDDLDVTAVALRFDPNRSAQSSPLRLKPFRCEVLSATASR